MSAMRDLFTDIQACLVNTNLTNHEIAYLYEVPVSWVQEAQDMLEPEPVYTEAQIDCFDTGFAD